MRAHAAIIAPTILCGRGLNRFAWRFISGLPSKTLYISYCDATHSNRVLIMNNSKNIVALQGETVVVKIGSLSEGAFGNAHTKSVLEDVQLLQRFGVNPIVVHGGGEEVSEVMRSRGMTPVFFRGLRVTDGPALEVVKEVMPKIGLEIAKSISALGGNAEHLLGYMGLLRVCPIEYLGYVGNVVYVNAGLLRCMMDGGAIPVVTPLGFEGGQIYNVNGDKAAGAMAASLKSARLVFVTDVDGVKGSQKVLPEIDGGLIEGMLQSGGISGGMEPKVRAGMFAKSNGVGRVSVINGTRDHALLHEILSDEGTGTNIVVRLRS